MKKTLWVLLDSRTGSVGQAKGVIAQLDSEKYDIIEKKLTYNKFSGLPNFIRGKTLVGLAPDSKKQIVPPFPDIILSTSRRTVPVARFIKKFRPSTKLVQLMHPGHTGLKEFSLVIVPEHDKNKAGFKNIRYIVGAPHRTTAENLAKAREGWEEKFATLPRPFTAVIVGGAIKGKAFSEENALALGRKIAEFKRQIGGALLITSSRRTGKKAEDIILGEVKNVPSHTFLWGDKSDNPYLGYLACADQMIVTGDSVSMCSEACGTGKPVFIFTGRHWLTRKHVRFIASLYKNGYAKALKMCNLGFKPKKSLNAAYDSAKMIDNL